MSVYANYQHTIWQGKNYTWLSFSSNFNYHDNHNFRFIPGQKKTEFEYVKVLISVMKQRIIASDRNYDPATKIWMIPRTEFEYIVKTFTTLGIVWTMKTDLASYVLTSKDLWDAEQELANNRRKANRDAKRAEAPQDFFHSFKEPPSPQSNKLTLAQLHAKIQDLIGEGVKAEITRKDYLRACMRLHPDRNNGDGSKMSELNSLWQEYQKLCPANQLTTR